MIKMKTSKHFFWTLLTLILTSSIVQAQEINTFSSMPKQVLEAKKKGNIRVADSIASLYVDNYLLKLSEPELYTKDNLDFIAQNLGNENSKAFSFFLKRSEKINAVLGDYASQNKVINLIEVNYLPGEESWRTVKPDWDRIEKRIRKRFGVIGLEAVLGRRMVYHWEMEDNWDDYAKYYTLYFQRALRHSKYHVNNFSWSIFEHINDSKTLAFACNVVMRYAIEEWYENDPVAWDTYANLLYKTGKRDQAIEWEEKAVKMKIGQSDEKLYTDALDKMKRGLPTWITLANNP